MRNKIWICCFSAVFLLICALGLLLEQVGTTIVPFTLSVTTDGKTEEIDCWKAKDGHYYLFLPSYADLSFTSVHLNTSVEQTIDGVRLTEGMCCDAFCLDEPYSYTIHGESSEITFLRSANIPAMYIDTQTDSMEYIHEKKGNKETSSIRLYTSDGEQNYFGTEDSIQGRGNYSWLNSSKKPYSLTLSQGADLLGMGTAQRWILLANADDESHLRNKLVYDYAVQLGLAYSPQSRWVDLYLNGQYAGLYLLCERNEVHEERVNIAQANSFLVSLEAEDRLTSQNYPYVTTSALQSLRVHYPLQPSDMERQNILQTWQSIENAVLSEDAIDPVTQKHLTELIDLDSWARKYLIEELFGNGDACDLSQFFYSDSGQKVYAGPVWDFDRTMGDDVAWQLNAPNTIFAARKEVREGRERPWFYTLYQNDVFYSRVTELYQSECLPLLQRMLEEDIFGYVGTISQAARMNQIRWEIEKSAEEGTEQIVEFMAQRLKFLSGLWVDGTQYCTVRLDHSFGGNYAYILIETEELMTQLPEFEDTQQFCFLGWYCVDTDEPFDASKPITEDISLYAKWEERPQEKLKDLLKLAPAAVMALIFFTMLVIENKKERKTG